MLLWKYGATLIRSLLGEISTRSGKRSCARLPANGCFPPTDDDLERIVNDPRCHSSSCSRRHRAAAATWPVGSAIVAETFFGALKALPVPGENLPLRQAIAECGGALLGARDLPRHSAAPAIESAVVKALADIDETTSMTTLLSYMERVQAFARA